MALMNVFINIYVYLLRKKASAKLHYKKNNKKTYKTLKIRLSYMKLIRSGITKTIEMNRWEQLISPARRKDGICKPRSASDIAVGCRCVRGDATTATFWASTVQLWWVAGRQEKSKVTKNLGLWCGFCRFGSLLRPGKGPCAQFRHGNGIHRC